MEDKNRNLWRVAILDQIVDAKCAIESGMNDYADECLMNARAMLKDMLAFKDARMIDKLYFQEKKSDKE